MMGIPGVAYEVKLSLIWYESYVGIGCLTILEKSDTFSLIIDKFWDYVL